MRTHLAVVTLLALTCACHNPGDAPPPPAASSAATLSASTPAPPQAAPGSVQGPASPAIAAPFQGCTADVQCTIVSNGCCSLGGPEPTIAVRREREAAFKAIFQCESTPCRTSAVLRCKPTPPCKNDECTMEEMAACDPLVEVAKCVAGRCTITE